MWKVKETVYFIKSNNNTWFLTEKGTADIAIGDSVKLEKLDDNKYQIVEEDFDYILYLPDKLVEKISKEWEIWFTDGGETSIKSSFGKFLSFESARYKCNAINNSGDEKHLYYFPLLSQLDNDR